uniref:Ribosomal protein S3 n=1 Tax=Wickerhamomyces pijperi TaxID=599730 RepID=S5U4W6_WICPI|nr:ribosomal protein S3 [Wickerhamomyces pijperi]AGS44408.1 ribosomal protein S3 [Wickerhamomyces pijperi]
MKNNQKFTYLYKLSNNYVNNKTNKNLILLKHYLQEYNNKGTKLQSSNKMNNWLNQLYKFNKTSVVNTLLLDKLVSNLLIKLFTIKYINNKLNTVSKGALREIYINKPQFKHTVNTVYIYFNYNDTLLNINNKENYKENYNLYYTSLSNSINNILGSYNFNKFNLNNISNYLSTLYNKEVVIVPNKLKYNYNDSVILNKTIVNNIDKFKGGLAGNYSKLLRNNVPVNNSLLIKNNYISNIIDNYNIKYNNILNFNNINLLNKNNSNIGITDIYNTLSMDKITSDLLINKYIIGLSVLYKGKNLNKAGISRSIKDKLLFGSLSNKLYKKYNGLLTFNNNGLNNQMLNIDINLNKKYSLNYIPNHHSISQDFKVNKVKTGVFGISVKLNTI